MHSELYKFISNHLGRTVELSLFTDHIKSEPITHIIIINDGQDLSKMDFKAIFKQTIQEGVNPLVIGCSAAPGEQRKQEYGVQWAKDYAGRGAKAGHYALFITQELIPWIPQRFDIHYKVQTSIAGWSLGGLSAIDIAWHAPHLFQKIGVFSGSLWWRNPHLIDDDVHHRLMHHKVKHTSSTSNLKFWFHAGTEDEIADRNNNGVIDAIDDTLDLMDELEAKGYQKKKDMHFHIEIGGRHDVQTWSKVMPMFLEWVQQ